LAVSRELGASSVKIKTNSQVVAGQIQGDYEAKRERMKKYLEKANESWNYINTVVIEKIPEK
jgi:ribonuclease HI